MRTNGQTRRQVSGAVAATDRVSFFQHLARTSSSHTFFHQSAAQARMQCAFHRHRVFRLYAWPRTTIVFLVSSLDRELQKTAFWSKEGGAIAFCQWKMSIVVLSLTEKIEPPRHDGSQRYIVFHTTKKQRDYSLVWILKDKNTPRPRTSSKVFRKIIPRTQHSHGTVHNVTVTFLFWVVRRRNRPMDGTRPVVCGPVLALSTSNS